MTCITTPFVSAATTEPSDIQIVSVESTDDMQEIVLSEDGTETKITLLENDSDIKTTIEDTETGDKEVFLLDKENGTLYSSITGETIDVSEEITAAKDFNDVSSGIRKAKRKDASGSIKISYAKMSKALGKAASASNIAALILSIFSAGMSYPVLTTVALLVSNFSNILSIICSKYSKGSPDHGVKVSYKRITIKKHQAGHVFETYKYKITNLGTY